MAVNLLRNAKVFFTTNVNSTDGTVATTGHQAVYTTALFTQELQVLDGFSFSQNTTADTITLNESGSTPKRGQRMFNTSLDPVEWSFSTYIRPEYRENTVTSGIDADDRVICEERVLWNAMFSNSIIGSGTAAYSEQVGSAGPTTPYARITLANSNLNQLQKFGLIIVFDDQTFVIDNCAIDTATIDFGLDQIGTIAWTGRGSTMRRLATAGTASAGTFGGGLTGSYAQKSTSAKYIANKLSAAQLVSLNNQYGLGATTTYPLAITGGNITISNNLTYLIPANIGVVNKAIDYYTGNRSVTGSITAYLRTGSQDTGALMTQLISATDFSENMYAITLGLGGTVTTPTTTSAENKVVFYCPQAMVQIPQVNTEQIVTATINFNAQAGNGSVTGTTVQTITNGSTYDIEGANEMYITYYSGPAT